MKISELKERIARIGVLIERSKLHSVNGKPAYMIDGAHGLYTKSYLINLLGEYQ